MCGDECDGILLGVLLNVSRLWNVLLDVQIEDIFLGVYRRPRVFAYVTSWHNVFLDIKIQHGAVCWAHFTSVILWPSLPRK